MPADFYALAERYGLPVAMLLFAVMALYFDLVVSGQRYRQVRRERDALLRILVGHVRTSERAASAADRNAGMAERAVAALVERSAADADAVD